MERRYGSHQHHPRRPSGGEPWSRPERLNANEERFSYQHGKHDERADNQERKFVWFRHKRIERLLYTQLERTLRALKR